MKKHPEARYYASTRVLAQCPSCRQNIGQLEEPYKRLLEQGKTSGEALNSLRIHRPCCRLRIAWPVVLPLGGLVMPGGEAALNNYLGFKPRPPKPNLVVLSLRSAANGEHIIVSHVTKDGLIGNVTRPDIREPTEVTVWGDHLQDPSQRPIGALDELPKELTELARPRIYTDPGEISRAFPYRVIQSQPPYPGSTGVRSFFDLPREQQEKAMEGEETVARSCPVECSTDDEEESKEKLEEHDDYDMLMREGEEMDDEPLVPTGPEEEAQAEAEPALAEPAEA